MEDILKKILEIDRLEHDLIVEAEEIRNKAKEDIEIHKEELRQEYLNKALADAEKKRSKESEEIVKELEKSDEATERALAELEKHFEEIKEKSVKEIIDRMKS